MTNAFQRVLLVGAHCDDLEIGCGGTAHRLVREGSQVFGLIVTDTHHVKKGVALRDGAVAKAEAERAAAIIGYTPLFGSFRNNQLSLSQDLIWFIRDHIERVQADTIFTHWHLAPHPDHRLVAEATLAATRDPRNVLLYRSNRYKTASGFAGQLAVDVSADFDSKMKALTEYASERSRLGEDAFEWVRLENQLEGQRNGVAYAEAFHIVKACI